MEVDIKLLSFNVRGLRDNAKRNQIFYWLKHKHNGDKAFILLQETHSIATDEKKWEMEWGAKIAWDHGTTKSCGVAILFPQHIGDDFEVVNSFNSGRKVIVKVKQNNEALYLLNAYSPTQDNATDQLHFIRSLRSDIENYTGNLIIGGDLNMYLNPMLDKDDTLNGLTNNEAAREMNNILNECNYIDIWRILNFKSKRYTWRRKKPLIQSRLDYWLIPNELIYDVEKCDIKPSIKSDHSLITLDLKSSRIAKRGPGLWKFNASLINDSEYVRQVKEIIKEDYETNSKSQKWEYIKMKVREFSIKFSKNIAYEKRREEKLIMNDIEIIEKGLNSNTSSEDITKLEILKSKLEAINNSKATGALLRARATWVEKGEKNTKLFLNMEKRNYNVKHITRLKTGGLNEQYTEDPNQILQLLKNFYQDLYSHDSRNDQFDALFTENLPQLSDNSILLTEKDFGIEELTCALNLMKNGKNPGSDGLTVEFYKHFWPDVKYIIYESLQECIQDKMLSVEQRRAIIRLIPKKDKDITEIKNWRPISLLNTDYKLIAMCLAQRLQKVIPEIISPDQNGYVKGRFIGFSVRTIIDVIEKSNIDNMDTIIAFLDFEKAFDKLNWTYLDKALEAFGFCQKFREYICIMYNKISSSVINNGYTSPYFTLKCGIRQGCPLSALLFIIAAETLANNLKKNCNIKGINLNGMEVKITQMADDTTLFLDNIQSLHTVLNTLFMFCKSSGLKLNYSKTEILYLGKKSFCKRNPFNLKWVRDRVYALGTWFYKDVDECVSTNHKTCFSKFKHILDIWRPRYLTWFGRITILKTLALSKLNYCIMSLTTPQWFINDVQKELDKFLWMDKPARIKQKTVIGSYKDGGLRHPHFNSFVQAQKVKWATRLANSQLQCARYVSKFTPPISMSHFLNCSFSPDRLPISTPSFYKQILYAWFQYKSAETNTTVGDIIWFNENIKVNNELVYYQNWYEKGVIYVNDLIHDSNRWLSYDEFVAKFGINVNFVLYYGLIDSMNKTWLPVATCVPNQPKIKLPQDCYWNIIRHIVKPPTSVQSWYKDHEILLTDKTWESIFLLPHKLTLDAKLIELQLKILHRTYATDSYVSNFNEDVSKICKKCQTKNDLFHCFVECEKVKGFWKMWTKWYNKHCELIYLNKLYIMFGEVHSSERKNFTINYCLLHAKMHIHKCRLSDADVPFITYLLRLKDSVNIEKEIALVNNTMDKFMEKFGKIEEIL